MVLSSGLPRPPLPSRQREYLRNGLRTTRVLCYAADSSDVTFIAPAFFMYSSPLLPPFLSLTSCFPFCSSDHRQRLANDLNVLKVKNTASYTTCLRWYVKTVGGVHAERKKKKKKTSWGLPARPVTLWTAVPARTRNTKCVAEIPFE